MVWKLAEWFGSWPNGLEAGQMVWKLAEWFGSCPNDMKAVQPPGLLESWLNDSQKHTSKVVFLTVHASLLTRFLILCTPAKSSRPAYNSLVNGLQTGRRFEIRL